MPPDLIRGRGQGWSGRISPQGPVRPPSGARARVAQRRRGGGAGGRAPAARPRAGRAADPEPWRAYIYNGIETPETIAFAKLQHEHAEAMTDIFRKLVDFYEVHKCCPRAACR